MGTDIHLWVEYYDGKEWQPIYPPFISRFMTESYPPSLEWTRNWETGDYVPDNENPDPKERNYNVFAFLADVRNGSGFAGVPTHKPIVPQFPERGVPEDCSYNHRTTMIAHNDRYNEDEEFLVVNGEKVHDIWLGDHSFTYATLEELVTAPWDIEFDAVGIVGPDEYRVFKEEGVPSSWSGGIWGGNVVVYDDEQEFLKAFEDAQDSSSAIVTTDYDFPNIFYRARWTWQPLLKSGFKEWLDKFLQPWADEHAVDYRDVRVVMGFDS